MPTLKDIAGLAGVSTCTVSRYMNNDIVVRPETEARIKAAIQELGYVTNTVAKSLKRNSTDNVAVVLPRINNLYYAEMTSGISRTLSAAGYNLIIYEVENHHADEAETLDWLRQNLVAGVIFIGMSYDHSFEESARRLPEWNIPAVYTNRFVQYQGVPLLYPSFGRAGVLAAEHLRARGCQRVALVHHQGRDDLMNLYLQGFAAVYGTEGACRALEVDAQGVTPAFVEALRKDGTDGIFALNERLAVTLAKWLGRAGVRIPDDIALLGFGSSQLSQLCTPELSCIDLKDRELGARSAGLILDMIQNRTADPVTEVEPVLIQREST